MIDSLHRSRLSDFAHRGLSVPRDPRGRVMAAAATLLLYAGLLFLALKGVVWVTPLKDVVAPAEVVQLLPSAPQPHLRIQDFNVRLIRPRLENAPLPQIVVAPEPSNAPRATLPASAVKESSIAGGAATGKAGGISGVGTGGSGTGVAACMDAAYLQQILRHVGGWYNYPDWQRHAHVTGVVYVHFVIGKDGRYHKLDMLKSSGDTALDGAAMQTMRQAEPLPPIPDRFHTDRLDGVLPIIYQGRAPLVAEQVGHAPGGC